ncbi:hypothetical protein J5Y03_07810 [Bacillus sp. RG28]|uniref:Uncharacterized protein n=1 Tax=Gottfriedia endophytica TaxID=2820819 RepID=A0A940NJ70_9BACI|nr:hypothetical protein [Gottfriedia endophytica]MBP0725097.1 hypothetical protein [Gottfriedia endophytica]
MKIFAIFILLFCLTFAVVLWTNMSQYETFTSYFQYIIQFRNNLSREDYVLLIGFFLPLVIPWVVNIYQNQKKKDKEVSNKSIT